MNAVLSPSALFAPARRINLLVIHCSATPSGRWLRGARGAAGFTRAVRVIDSWHAARGFRRSAALAEKFNPELPSIGYHFVVDLDGQVDTGRSLPEVGAHVAGFNGQSVGICLVGGSERDARFTAAQWRTLDALVRGLCGDLRIPLALPLHPRQGAGVCGHRDLSPDTDGDGRITPREWLKTCPGFDVGAWISRGCEPLPDQVIQEVPTA